MFLFPYFNDIDVESFFKKTGNNFQRSCSEINLEDVNKIFVF